MDAAGMKKLANVEFLSLSTNNISSIDNLQYCANLTILSLSRNKISSIRKLYPLRKTLTELWISYNQISKLEDIEYFSKLQVLNVGYNKISTWSEVHRLRQLPRLHHLLMTGNPVEEELHGSWRINVIAECNHLTKLDCRAVTVDERAQARLMLEDMAQHDLEHGGEGSHAVLGMAGSISNSASVMELDEVASRDRSMSVPTVDPSQVPVVIEPSNHRRMSTAFSHDSRLDSFDALLTEPSPPPPPPVLTTTAATPNPDEPVMSSSPSSSSTSSSSSPSKAQQSASTLQFGVPP